MEVGHAGMKMVLKAKGQYNLFKVPVQGEEPAGVVPDPDGQLLEQVDEPFATIFDESASHVDKKKKKKKNKTKPDPEPAEEPSGHVPKKKKVKKSKSVEPEPESPPRKEYQCKVCDKIKRSKKAMKKHMAKHIIDEDASNMVSFTKGSDEVSSTKGSDEVSSTKGSTVLHSGQKLQCTECDRQYSNTFTLRRHMETIHGTEKESLPRVPNTRKDCKWCGRYCLL